MLDIPIPVSRRPYRRNPRREIVTNDQKELVVKEIEKDDVSRDHGKEEEAIDLE
jgi:hypothetical protein